MSNEYYEPQPDVAPGTKARSGDLNALDNGVAAAFDKLPAPAALASGTVNYALDSGSVANGYVVALPKITAYTDGLSVKINTTRANTGAATLNINGIGAIAIKRLDGTDLQADDIQANAPVALTYVEATNRFMMPNLVASQIKQAATSATNAAASATQAANSAQAAANSATAAQNAAGTAAANTASQLLQMTQDDVDAANASASTASTKAGEAAASAASIARDGANGVAGLTNFGHNLYNAAGTIKSMIASAATAVRTWTMPDKSGTVALTSDLTTTRNGIMNGNFAVNQRLVSGTVTLAAGVYGHDRWKAGAAGCTYTFATNGADTTLTITAGSLMQVVEGANVEGGVYILSRSGSAQARIGVNGAAPTGSYAALPLSSANASAGQAVTVEFSTGTLGLVQLENSPVATPFGRRHYGAELMLCQRYYQVIQGGDLMAAAYSASDVMCAIRFNVDMRTAPTMSAPSWGALVGNASNGTITAGSFAAISTRAAQLDLTAFTGITPAVGLGYVVRGASFRADAEL